MDNFKQLFNQYKYALIAVLVLFAAYYIYTTYIVTEEGGYLRSENKELIDSEVGQRIVTRLNRLKTISIDTDFFTDPYFRTLIDYSRDLGVPQKSKENPFLPSTEPTTLTVGANTTTVTTPDEEEDVVVDEEPVALEDEPNTDEGI